MRTCDVRRCGASARSREKKARSGLWNVTTPPPPLGSGTLLTSPEVCLNLEFRVVVGKIWRIEFDFSGRCMVS